MRLGKFLSSKIFFKHLGLATIIAIALIWVTLLSLRLYTHHGQELTVPNFYGKSLNETEQLIKENSLRYQVIDSVYRPHLAPGSILEQSPVAGFKVKQNRTIFLTINAKNPEKVRFPNLVNSSFRQAIAILETNGFQIGHLEYASSEFANLVLQQKYKGDTIPEGELIIKGATIDLVVGKGRNNQSVLVPTLIGKNPKEAKDLIIHANLNLGKSYFDETVQNSQDSLQAQVWKQSPTFGENIKLKRGSYVRIWLTRDTAKIPNADSLIMIKMGSQLY
ncbi:MAG: PASTA domain-containing protein [Marinifilaceae bacterium]|jgi:beta-lactam-binding protein with PASTA domain